MFGSGVGAETGRVMAIGERERERERERETRYEENGVGREQLRSFSRV